jgi:TolB protein
MKKTFWILAAAAVGAVLLSALPQQSDISIVLRKNGQLPALAVPDLRGDAQSQSLMGVFNDTLWKDLDGAGIFRMVPKTQYPLTVPQQLTDFKAGQASATGPGNGTWLTDWSAPPAQANYVTIGYGYVQGGLFALRGWLVDLSIASPANAGALAKTYAESLDEAGARKVAHEFARDILERFGQKSTFGTHIYFERSTGSLKDPVHEIWSMDPDGANQKQITHFNVISEFPSVSADGSKLAFNSYLHGNPAIFVFSVDPVRDLRFYNQRGASVTATPSFTPDGKQIVFMSSAAGCCRIFISNIDGSNVHSVSSGTSIDAEPKVNPKNGSSVAFSSGRSGPEQIYMMNIDGTDVERLTEGSGEASNPSWHPDGQFLAFAWTRGFMAGAFNIFVMDVSKRNYQQLTHGEGKNENPSWAPDGKHLVFMSTRSGRSQIWSMLADGTQLQQLTTQGTNLHPVWGN